MPSYRDIRSDTGGGGGGGGGVAVGPGAAGRIVLVDATGAIVSAFDALTYDDSTKLWKVEASAAGAVLSSLVSNQATSANSAALNEVRVNGASAGDPFTLWSIAGVVSVCAGLDNDDSDLFKILAASTLNGTTAGFRMSTTGNVGQVAFGATSPSPTTGVIVNIRENNSNPTTFSLGNIHANGAQYTVYSTNVVTNFRARDSANSFLGTSTSQTSVLEHSAGSGGLKIGTSNSADVDIGTNNARRVKFAAAGGAQWATGICVATREISNADATVTIADGSVAQTGTLSANRTFTLPPGASTPNGFRVIVSVNAVSGTGFKVTVSGDININGAASYDLDTDWETATLVKHTNEWRVF